MDVLYECCSLSNETLEEKEVRLAKWDVELQERKLELDDRHAKLEAHEDEFQKKKNDLFGLAAELEKRKFDEFQNLMYNKKQQKKKPKRREDSPQILGQPGLNVSSSSIGSQETNSPIEEGVITPKDQKFLEDIQRLLERHDYDINKLRSKSVKGLEEDKLKRYWKLKGFKEDFPSTDLKKGWKTSTLERIIDNISPCKMKEIIGKSKMENNWVYQVSWVFKHKPEMEGKKATWENPDQLTDEYLEDFNRLLAIFNTEK